MKGRGGGKAAASKKRDATAEAVERIRRQREARRRSAENFRREREIESARNEKSGNPGDVDFQRMIRRYRAEQAGSYQPHSAPGKDKVTIVVRKRPQNSREKSRKDFDAVTCVNPRAVVHACKLKVDGISKYLENQAFAFDHAFSEADDTPMIYAHTVQPLVGYMFYRGRGTCFAYGQTGSGKTYTMTGVQAMAARDIYAELGKPEHRARKLGVYLSFFEIYGGRCQDLLNGRAKVTIREDGAGRVNRVGLGAVRCDGVEALLAAIERGNEARTTHSTAVNSVSSRSHAICDIVVKDTAGRMWGKLSLIDLAGSERAADTRSHNRYRRLESAEINKSLLALKECIRALDSGSGHVPFRASKLTLVLKDTFTSKAAKVAMVATVSPGASSADHTINTLRYADRVKEKKAKAGGGGGRAGAVPAYGKGLGAPEVERSYPSRIETSPLTVEDDDAGAAAAAPEPRSPRRAAARAEGGVAGSVGGRRRAVGRIPDRAGRPGDGRRAEPGARGAASAAARQPARRRPADASDRAVRGGLGEGEGKTSEADEPKLMRGPPGGSEAGARSGRGRAGGQGSGSRRRAEIPADFEEDSEEELRSEFKRDLMSGRGAGSGSGSGGAARAGRGVPSSGSGEAPRRDPFEEADRAGGGRSGAGASHGGAGSSPQKDDLRMLHATLSRDEKGTSGRWLEFHEIMDRIVEEEEQLLNAHMKQIQDNADDLTEEGALLSKVQGNEVVDYDIDGYAAQLQDILKRKMERTQRLLAQVGSFRKHLALEDELSKKYGNDGLAMPWDGQQQQQLGGGGSAGSGR